MIKVIKLYNSWCSSSIILDKMLRDLNIKYENISIDSLDGEGVSLKYNIKTTPALLILDKEDNLIRKMLGLPNNSIDLIKFIYETN